MKHKIDYYKELVKNSKFFKKLHDFNMDELLDMALKDIMDGVISIQKYFEYINEKYNYPQKNYEIANKPFQGDLSFKKIALVLSGGGARGVAHIGVIHELMRRNIRPICIVGTSIGAIVGSLMAQGDTTDIMMDFWKQHEKIISQLQYPSLFFPSKFTKILDTLVNKSIRIKKIENMFTPLYINCTDIKTGERILFSEGDVIPAVKGSASIPFLFKPVEYQNNLLIDGGTADNFAIDAARKFNPDYIIVSDVSASTDKTSNFQQLYFGLQVSKEVTDSLKIIGTKLLPIRSEKDIMSYINNLMFILSKRGDLQPNVNDGEIVISPLLENMDVFEFNKRDFAFEKGREAANLVFDKVQ